MSQADTSRSFISRLASYYLEIIKATSSRRSSHLFNLGAARSNVIVADLLPLLEQWSEILDGDKVTLRLPSVDTIHIRDIVAHASEEEEREEEEARSDTTVNGTDQERPAQYSDVHDSEAAAREAADALLATYRKQEQDPYNLETLLGFGILTGTHGSLRYCSPLFYFPVHVEYDPLNRVVRLHKDTTAPNLNLYLIVSLADDDGLLAVIRRHVMPLLHEDFTAATIDQVSRMLKDLVPALRGLVYDSRSAVPLTEALSKGHDGPPLILNTCLTINARRSHAFLLDDLVELSKLEGTAGETAASVFEAAPQDDSGQDSDAMDGQGLPVPLLFPLQSNAAQERAARSAERRTLTVIEGPPGTGKSQTIANLVCHLVGQGKTVLVTSHQNKALEVVMDKLPQLEDDPSREYLAMAMLKGEAESARQLADKLRHFDATLASGSQQQLEASLRSAQDQLRDAHAQIRRLKARFSELKDLERQAARGKTHYRYHEIRSFDGIHPEDHIAEGAEHQVSEVLSRWAQAVDELKEYWTGLCSTLMQFSGASSTEVVEQRITLLRELVRLYKEAENLAGSPLASRVLELGSISSSPWYLRFLKTFNNWLKANGDRLISLRTSLAESGERDWYKASALLNPARQYSEGLLHQLVERANQVEAETRDLISDTVTGPSSPASDVALLGLEDALGQVESAARFWLRWHLSIGVRSSIKFLERAGFGRLRYGRCWNQLAAARRWVEHWKARYEAAAFLDRVSELGLPLTPVSADTSPVILARRITIARVSLELLTMLSRIPTPGEEATTVEPVYAVLDSITSSHSLEQALTALALSIAHLERLESLESLKTNPALSDMWATMLKGWYESIRSLEVRSEVGESCRSLERLLGHADSFLSAIKLERGALSGLARTLGEARPRILAGDFPQWLREPELAVEAHRLRALILEDLKTTPDDISAAAAKLRELQEETRRLAITGLRRQRRLELWTAAHSGHVRTEIDRLRRTLTKRKKTASLVELRDRIDFHAVLAVFPCWVMGIDDVARVFPLKAGLFDYVIVDEASQCHQATALHLAYRARKLVIVGDEKQLQNPQARFLSENQVRVLLDKYDLQDHPNADVLDARVSLLGLARRLCGRSYEFLNEHFRSEPAIIAWSNKHFYGNRLRVLTPIWPRRFEPCMEVRVVDGADDDPAVSRTNELEARAVISELRSLIENPEYEGLTLGVISPFRQQADILQHMIHVEFADHPEWVRSRQIVASTADGFQGDERDVVLYSMRYGPSSPPGAITAIQMEQERLNVAFTRARRRVVCFISVPIERFPRHSRRWGSGDEEPSIRSFLEHAMREQRSPQGRLGTDQGDKFDSDFEQDVCLALRARGLRVFTQVPCAGFFIDLVAVDDEGRRIAIECDGDFHFEDGELRPDDYQRQDIIERAGWTVVRVPFRSFYLNPIAAVDRVVEMLRSLPSDAETLVRDLDMPASPVGVHEAGLQGDITSAERWQEVQCVIHEAGQRPEEEVLGAGVQREVTSQQEESDGPSGDDFLLGHGHISSARNWFALSHWGKETGLLKPFDRGFAFNIGRYLAWGWPLSPKQIRYARDVWQSALAQGFQPGIEEAAQPPE